MQMCTNATHKIRCAKICIWQCTHSVNLYITTLAITIYLGVCGLS